MSKILVLLVTGVMLVSGCAGQRPSSTRDASATERDREAVMRTGILEARAGYTGDKFGVEVEDVSVVGDGEVQAVELKLPFTMDEVDRIEVESAAGEAVELPREVEIEPGTDPNNTGVRIYLPKRKTWEFRIRIIDLPGDE